ncbi:GDSL esterase/lipase 5 [Olea europaea var. sylvestris]|uniref:GDSL esterase/lipase 5 n=1 Tax=Olea europaea var. sylvestris TaxID=158386 RepID=UPI000C1CED67|nr:GDSL esterase/lipase 5 [Olea europaea var. sylvestris]
MAKVLILIFLALSIRANCTQLIEYCRKPPALFVFGDSFFDPGNNNYIKTTTLDQANFWPYGETYFKYPTGRFSDGRLISDFIAEHAKLPLIPPYLQPRDYDSYCGANFASAGAGVLPETFQGAVIDLRMQLKYFEKEVNAAQLRKKVGAFDSKMILSNAVFLFSIGTNDYISPFVLKNSSMLPSHQEYIAMVIGNLTQVVKAVYKRGGRKFGFLNLGDLGCLPGLRISKPQNGSGCLEEASTLAKLHNEALQNVLNKMKNHLKGFKYSLYDFNTFLRQILNHPSRYGFKEGEKACCGSGHYNGIFSCGGKRGVKEFELCKNPNEFIFWDSYHLTESVYKKMARQMWYGPSKGPYNLTQFFQCL